MDLIFNIWFMKKIQVKLDIAASNYTNKLNLNHTIE